MPLQIEEYPSRSPHVTPEPQYALQIGIVREVLDCTAITHVPRMPEYLKGVINLRGNVVPVVDLRLCFGLESAAQTVDTCIDIDRVLSAQQLADVEDGASNLVAA